MFQFSESATKIFEYSKGERGEDGKYKTLFADPAKIRRQLDISLPHRDQLVDQYLAGEKAKTRPTGETVIEKLPVDEDNPNGDKTREYKLLSDEDKAVIRMGAIAHDTLCLGLRDAFGLLPFDESTGVGCTDRMAIWVYNQYMEWLEKKDGSTPASATS